MTFFQKNVHLFLFLSIFSCTSTEKPATKIIPDQVTLIFINRPDNAFYREHGGRFTVTMGHQFSYYDQDLIRRWITPDSTAVGDTIIIPTQHAYREVFHAYRGMKTLSLLIEKGDTIVFTYDDFKPKAYSKKYQAATFDLNLSLNMMEDVFENDFSALEQYRVAPYEELIKIGNPFESEEFTAKRYIENNKKRAWLVNQYDSGKISKIYFDHYDKLLDAERIEIEDSFQPLSQERFKEIVENIDDSDLDKGYNRMLLHLYVDHLSRDAAVFGYQSSGGGGSHRDYVYQYEALMHDRVMSPVAKDLYLFSTIDMMCQFMGKPELNTKYYHYFQVDAINPNLVARINRKYRLEKAVSDDLELETIDGKTTTFEEVLKRHHGKVIYVDIWAAGCPPCLKEVPLSKWLAVKYQDEDFVVLFISKDIKYDRWKEKCQKFNLDTEHSFIVNNLFTTSFFDKINSRFIPFYLIYDKNGKFDYIDAPRPSDHRIYSMIEERL